MVTDQLRWPEGIDNTFCRGHILLADIHAQV